jgi:hypothetical protein
MKEGAAFPSTGIVSRPVALGVELEKCSALDRKRRIPRLAWCDDQLAPAAREMKIVPGS